MIYSPHSYNPQTNKLGCMVYTTEEAEALLEERRKTGDLQPQLLKESHEKLLKEFDQLNGR